MKENCNNCNTDKYIVNRKRMLCDDCNHMRIHGETKQETQNKQHQKWLEKAKIREKAKPTKPQKNYTIKQSTAKNTAQKAELSKLKFSISEEALLNGEYFCKGCGQSNGGLDRSHILSVKQRPDLELDPNNIDLLCRECHVNWESWNPFKMIKLFCFESYLSYIYKKDEETFFKIFCKMEDIIERKVNWDTPPFEKIEQIVKEYYKKLT